jgi:hypothetical protein
MPRKPKKAQQQPEAPKSYDEFVDEAEGVDEDVSSAESTRAAAAQSKLRDWRDVEKFKEERMLRRAIDEDPDFDEPRRRR